MWFTYYKYHGILTSENDNFHKLLEVNNMPRGVKGSGTRQRKVDPVKDLDKKIADAEKALEKMKAEKRTLEITKNAEKLGDLYDLIKSSGISMADVKKAIKEYKPAPKKPRGRRPKKVEEPKAKKSITDEVMKDAAEAKK